MKIQLINEELLGQLHERAAKSERLRMNFDLRNTSEDGSQRMLNALEPGTKLAIHRHTKSAETVVCLEGCFDEVFYEELPCMDIGRTHDGEVAVDGSSFAEVARFRICPREGTYGIQIPMMAWHSVEVYEPSVIFEAKDGRYGG